jgi:arylsulfatase A-like enzyme
MMRTLVFALLIAALLSRFSAAADRPNILFIFTDDHAYQAMSCYGSKVNQTPNLDRIARDGMLFRTCLVTNSICGPSRAVIQTGKYSHKNGFLMNGNRFDGSQQTFPKLLQQAGYQTAVIGKWHLESDPQGYDYSEILIGQGPYYNPPMIKNGERVRHTGYTTEIITDLALEWLKTGRDASKPFMLMYQHKAPHREWQPGPGYFDKYEDEQIPEPETLFDDYAGRGTAAKQQDMTIAKTLTDLDLKFTPPRNLTPEQLATWNAAYEPRNEAFRKAGLQGDDLTRWKYQRYIKDYLRCIAAVDDNVGRVLDYLDETGLAQNTVVIYSSDQGFYLGEHGWFDKRWMYEESYRTPLLVRWPGVVRAGSENRDLVSNVDFAETFLEIAGVEIPADMQGRSLVPLLKGETPADWRKSHYYHYYEFLNDRKTPHMVRRHCGVRTERYKLIHFYNLGEWELYDLEKDPQEMRSVYSDPAYAGVVQEMTAELARLQEELEVPDDTGSVEKDPPSLRM